MLNNQTGLKRLIFAHAVTGGELPPINEYTVTGNPATFSTNLIRPLQSFEIPFTPVQSGSGDPSPSNVRPISGWSGITITANGETIMVLLDANGSVVYGGTLDAVTGVLTMEWAFMVADGSKFVSTETDSKGGVIFRSSVVGDMATTESSDSSSVTSSFVKPNSRTNVYSGNDGICLLSSGGTKRFWVKCAAFASLAEWTAYLDEHPLQIAYKLATPQTVQLTPVQVRTIIGQNSISASNNGTNTIKYLKRG